MAQWGNNNQANNAPKYKVQATSGANGSAMYANTTTGAFVPEEVIGVYGVSPANTTGNMASAGWVEEKRFTGPVTVITPNAAGSGYANGDVVTISAPGATNATATITVGANGAVTSYTLTAGGAGFVNAANTTTTFTTAAGVGATVNITLGGGRTGRKQFETLVAMSSIAPGGSSPV